MSDDTDHPLDATLGGDSLRSPPSSADAPSASADVITLPVIRVERSGKRRRGKARSAKAETRSNVGRPARYQPAFAEHARIACERGATDRELAGLFGVSVSTIYEWRLKHVEFSDAIHSAKQLADERVERSLYNRAVGYSFDAEKVFANGYRASVVEHLAPDVGAAQFWLKNRRPAQWRDVQKVDYTHRVRTSAEILDEIKRDVVELGLLPDGSFGEPGSSE